MAPLPHMYEVLVRNPRVFLQAGLPALSGNSFLYKYTSRCPGCQFLPGKISHSSWVSRVSQGFLRDFSVFRRLLITFLYFFRNHLLHLVHPPLSVHPAVFWHFPRRLRRYIPASLLSLYNYRQFTRIIHFFPDNDASLPPIPKDSPLFSPHPPEIPEFRL